ncbi:MAG: glutamate-cysteine ligase family protein, partial [Gemmatimonadales bacterium]
MTPTPRYRLFEVVGLELEYVIVDDSLRPRCLLEEAFRQIHRRPTSDIEHQHVGFSNELAAHVFEIKTLEPQRSLARVEADLVEGLRFFKGALEGRFGARLLPTGMHPFMRPADTTLWRRAGRAIYETYAGLFPIRQHGWLNVQASHINLPFDSEAKTVAMHNALVCLLPYLPALAASSPIYEGKIGPALDNRLEFYKENQRRFPVITGQVV